MSANPSCYSLDRHYNPEERKESVTYQYTNLLDAVDITYILTMESSTRTIDTVVHPKCTSLSGNNENTIIQMNKGYRKCNKKNVTNSAKDLIDALANCFSHALERGANRVMILEDDFIIEKRNFMKYATSINTYINKNDPEVYNLGPLAVYGLCIPTGGPHMRMLVGGIVTTTAVIYNTTYMKAFLHNCKHIEHADHFHVITSDIHFSSIPLITQLFPPTENQTTTWPQAGVYIVKMFNLNESTRHWTTLLSISIWLPWTILIAIAVVVVVIMSVCAINWNVHRHRRPIPKRT